MSTSATRAAVALDPGGGTLTVPVNASGDMLAAPVKAGPLAVLVDAGGGLLG